MKNNRFIERLRYLIQYFSGGSVTAFAEGIGVSQSTLQRNLTLEREDLLLKITPKILATHVAVRREWLLSGEGDPFAQSQVTKAYYEELIATEEKLEKTSVAYAALQQEHDALKNRYIQVLEQLTQLGAIATGPMGATTKPAPGSAAAAPSARYETERE